MTVTQQRTTKAAAPVRFLSHDEDRLPWLSAMVRADVDVYAKSVVLVLVAHMNARGECWPSLTTIARLGAVSVGTVRSRLRLLSALGYIRSWQPNPYKSTHYQATVPVLRDAPRVNDDGVVSSCTLGDTREDDEPGARVSPGDPSSHTLGAREPTTTNPVGGGGGGELTDVPADAGPPLATTVQTLRTLDEMCARATGAHPQGPFHLKLHDPNLARAVAPFVDRDPAALSRYITADMPANVTSWTGLAIKSLKELDTDLGRALLDEYRAELTTEQMLEAVNNAHEAFGVGDEDESPEWDASSAFDDSLDDLGWWDSLLGDASHTPEQIAEAYRRLQVALERFRQQMSSAPLRQQIRDLDDDARQVFLKRWAASDLPQILAENSGKAVLLKPSDFHALEELIAECAE